MLSDSSWIYYGPGSLYGAPFVTRCLLYRLHDIDCSILAYHEQNVFSEPEFVGRKGDANVTHFQSTCYPVTRICFHQSNSSLSTREELLDLPSNHLDLSDTSNLQMSFDQARITVEHIQLSCKEMFAAFPNLNAQFEDQISGTDYQVKGSVVVKYMGEAAPEVKFRCWKLSVENLIQKKYYDTWTPLEWSLTALDIGEEWIGTSEMRLEKR
jgi:hypothetical protein